MKNSRRASIALRSALQYLFIEFRKLKLRNERSGSQYKIENAGTYAVFRETVSKRNNDSQPAVLVVGFRLKLAGSNRSLHWLFQHVCIITTPFWCGLKGFNTKLWMVDQQTKNYMGIYQWTGERNARRYIDFLIPILQFFSVKKSIWFRRYPDTSLDAYLKSREQQG